MRFLILSIFASVAFTQDSSSQAASTSATSNARPSDATIPSSAVAQCAKQNNCGQDVSCLASCAKVPSPSSEKINDTTKCVADCDQTQPLESYITCQQKCITDNFMDYTAPEKPQSSSESSSAGNGESKDSAKSNGVKSSNSTGTGIQSDAQNTHIFFTSFTLLATALTVSYNL